jgi:hypothetical protein
MGKVLLLRTCDANMRSHGGFEWPREGHVAAADWSPDAVCGQGLHGLVDGVGNASLLTYAETDDANWLVIAADAENVVELRGKAKVPDCDVVYCGDRDGALAYLDANGCADKPVVYSTRTAGDRGTATAGYRGTATAGDRGTATAGDRGVLVITHYDSQRGIYRPVVAVVGENDIKPNVAYRLNDAGAFVPVGVTV